MRVTTLKFHLPLVKLLSYREFHRLPGKIQVFKQLATRHFGIYNLQGWTGPVMALYLFSHAPRNLVYSKHTRNSLGSVLVVRLCLCSGGALTGGLFSRTTHVGYYRGLNN